MKEAGVVLGAGLGRRLGRGPKAFLRIDGESLLERAVSLLSEGGIHRIAAVLPPVSCAVEGEPTRIVRVTNPEPESGPCASAVMGLAALEKEAPVELLVLHHVDHAAVEASDLAVLLRAAREAPAETARVVPTCGDRGGHPIAILGPGLEALRNTADPTSTTIRDVLREAGAALRVPAGPGVLRNLNTPSDLSAGDASQGAAS